MSINIFNYFYYFTKDQSKKANLLKLNSKKLFPPPYIFFTFVKLQVYLGLTNWT